jgi:hypothetical protein
MKDEDQEKQKLDKNSPKQNHKKHNKSSIHRNDETTSTTQTRRHHPNISLPLVLHPLAVAPNQKKTRPRSVSLVLFTKNAEK